MLSDEELNQVRKLIGTPDERIRRLIQEDLSRQKIMVPAPITNPPTYAGGSNLCPNSDFAFSYLAATQEGVLPSDVDPLNDEVYRVSRQIKETNITTTPTRLNKTEAAGWVPIWEKVQGVAEIGAVDGSDQYDIAFQFQNNWLVNNKKWYIRVAVATDDDEPLPEGLKLYAGFWIRNIDSSEGWSSGGTFTIEHKIFGVPGTRDLNYRVLAKTDTGVSVESQILNVPNAPDTLDSDNYIQLTYAAVAGFIEFEVYREDVLTGEVRQIARDRNSARLVAYDTGQEGRLEPGGFPSADSSDLRAYAEVPIDAVSIDVQKTFHNLAVRIPASFDTSTVASEGTYLRIGLTGPTAHNRQVWLDTIWASESNNVWSPSPYDDYPSPPSTTMVTAPPIGGGNPSNPPISGGGTSCVWVEHDLRLQHGWVKMGEADTKHYVENGLHGNPISHFKDGFVTQYLRFTFDCGLVINCSMEHRFVRSVFDSSGVMAPGLKVGDRVLGGEMGEKKDLLVVKRELIHTSMSEPLHVRAVKVKPDSENKLYAVGDSNTGWYVYCHNIKDRNPEDPYPVY